MTYAMLDDHFDEHPKYVDLELDELGLITCGITYANRVLSDGYLPIKAVRGFGKSGRGVRVAKGLVARGVWREADGGYEIVGFLDHNPSREEVLHARANSTEAKVRAGRAGGLLSGIARRAKAKAKAPAPDPPEAESKQTRSRCLRQNTEANEALSDPIRSDPTKDPPTPEAESRPSEVRPLAPARPLGGLPTAREIEYRAAFEAGVREAVGGRFAMTWTSADQSAINTWLQGYAFGQDGKAFRGAKLLEFVSAAAFDFATEVARAEEVQFFGLTPRGLLKWWAQDAAKQAQKREAKACP